MKEYLGDGVYVDIQNDMLKLTTEDGFDVLNTIYLEPQVYRALLRYAERSAVVGGMVNEHRRNCGRPMEEVEARASEPMDQDRGTQDQGDVHSSGL